MITSNIRRAALVVVIAAASAGLLAGCGPAKPGVGGGAPAGNGPAAAAGSGSRAAPAAGGRLPDPCGLITDDVATTAVGKPAGPGVQGGTADAPQCLYGNGALIIAVDNTGKAGYDSNHSSLTLGPPGTWQDVSGIGDGGGFEVSGGPTALVYFYKGSALIEIMLQGDLTAPADAAIVVAHAASVHA